MEHPFETALMRIIGQDRVSKLMIHGKPMWIATPGAIEEVVSLVRLASEYGKSVAAVGAKKQFDLHRDDEQVDLWIETAQLCSIIEYSPEDMVITVGAGMRLRDLQNELSNYHQFLPIDPIGGDDETLGSIVAANAWGPSRALYGTLRDHVIGTRTVLANGDVVRTGGRVVKNVAGYDLTKLLVGSFGSLGVMVEITFRVRPLPAQRTAVILSGSVDDVNHARAALMDSALIPSAFECANAPLAHALELSLGAKDALWLAVGCDEPVEGTAFQESVLREWSLAYSLEFMTLSPEQTSDLWRGYHHTLRNADVVLRVQGKPSVLIPLMGALSVTLDGQSVWMSACVPAGVLRVFFAAGDGTAQDVSSCVSQLSAYEVTLNYEKRPLDHSDYPKLDTPDAASGAKQTVHRHIYQAFDPAGLFSKTRIGGAK
ncbi:FAD-binding oxidoreductase [Ferroacidibacillus organovorans]|uniref:FAD-binding PCMH-type domain-containing protein n=1 Tax=Ferroacidibacillus organovorans TaxID=1765683 RepID=A0A101XSN3_9BACL|nr:FAD-binding oxidoreductase [Ferroacidibacillus organovorans]KUO96818.1 hypothetical protein ATW55_08390 [Ferroacidibacillus organovorans]